MRLSTKAKRWKRSVRRAKTVRYISHMAQQSRVTRWMWSLSMRNRSWIFLRSRQIFFNARMPRFTIGAHFRGIVSQPDPLRKGAHRGLHQCNGNYVPQINPVNGLMARCALAAKKVRYWETIPKIFGVSADEDHRPCPFRGEAFQWMRNVVLAEALRSDRSLPTAVIAAYAEGGRFDTAKKVRAGVLGHPAASSAKLVIPMSYDSIVALAKEGSALPDEWEDLGAWVERKISAASH
jgi:hypothetical protein